MIRVHGDAVEADLAFVGIDLRDLHRPGMRLTYRRLGLLVARLRSSPESWLWLALDAETEADQQTETKDKLRERQAFYDQKGAT